MRSSEHTETMNNNNGISFFFFVVVDSVLGRRGKEYYALASFFLPGPCLFMKSRMHYNQSLLLLLSLLASCLYYLPVYYAAVKSS